MTEEEIEQLDPHKLADLKNALEREIKKREGGPKVITYYVNSAIHDTRYFADLSCALRCLKQVAEELIEWVSEDEENAKYIDKCTGILGAKFKVEEMPKANFDIRQAESYFDDMCFPEAAK
jgi:hypothetical protein